MNHRWINHDFKSSVRLSMSHLWSKVYSINVYQQRSKPTSKIFPFDQHWSKNIIYDRESISMTQYWFYEIVSTSTLNRRWNSYLSINYDRCIDRCIDRMKLKHSPIHTRSIIDLCRSTFIVWIKINYDRVLIECLWSQNF